MLIIFGVALFAPRVNATDTWNGTSSTDWFTATNWTPNTVPVATDNITINNGLTGPVIGSAGAVGSTVQIGLSSATGVLTIQNTGTLSDQTADIGYLATGTVTVTGANTDWTNTQKIILGTVGTGTVSIENGAHASDSTGSSIGLYGGGQGTVTVDGAGSLWSNGGTLTLGDAGSTGTLNIQNSGSVTVASDSYISNSGGSSGTATITGPNSTWTITGNLYDGYGSGTGLMTISNGGSVSDVAGSVGTNGGGSNGTANVTGPSSAWTNSGDLSVGQGGGTGVVNISSGGTVSDVGGTIGSNTGGTGTVNVVGTGSTWTNSGDVTFGIYGGTGYMTISNGGAVSSANGTIGAYGSVGSVTVTDASSTWNNSANLNVGVFAGTASLTISNGGAVSDVIGTVGANYGTSATATVTGTNSIWVNTGDLFIATAQGNGTLLISSGGTVSDVNGYLEQSTGTGTATLTGANSKWTNTGNFYLNSGGASGTLTVSNGGVLSDTTGYVDVGGTVASATVTGANAIWANSGDLKIGYNGGTGTLTVSNGGEVSTGSGINYSDPANGASTSSGTIYIASNGSSSVGTLNIGAGLGNPAVAPGIVTANTVSFGNGTGTVVFNHTSDNYVFTPAITGNGLVDIASGTTVLTGNSSGFTGTTAVMSGGSLEVDSALGGQLNVNSGGQLLGSGTLGNLSVASGATISPGATSSNSIGTLTVAGTYTQSAGSTMLISLSPVTASKLSVTGSASLGGTLSLMPSGTSVRGAYTPGSSFEIINANSVTGTFTNVTNASSNYVQFSVMYNSNDVLLTVASVAPPPTNFTSNANTSNQTSLAAALDRTSQLVTSGNFNNTLNVLAGLDGAVQQQALNQLNNNIGPVLVSGGNNNLHTVMDSIGSRFNGGKEQGDYTLSSDFETNGEVQVADASDMMWGPDPSLRSDMTAWFKGFGASSNIGSTSTGSGSHSRLGGGAFGMEGRPTHEDQTGISFGAVTNNMSSDGVDQGAIETTYLLGIYGSHGWGQYFVDGTVLVGYNNVTTQRQINFIGQEARGTTDGYDAGIRTGLGYRLNLEDSSSTTLTPRVGLEYSYTYENGYTETGAPGANLKIGSGNQNLLRSTAGATVATKFLLSHQNGTLDTFRPDLSVGWQHDLFNPVSDTTEAFAGVPLSTFTTRSVNPGRDAAIIGLGFTLVPGDAKAFTIYTRYDGNFAANEIDHTITGGLKYSW